MRTFMLGVFLAIGLAALPARAQQNLQPTPAPLVDAANEAWQIAGEPLLTDGLIYIPSGPDRFFDGNVMVRTGAYRGIPIYQDTTLEPSSVVYVPIAGNQMRPYERRRSGELAQTVGSRTPGFPVESVAVSSESADYRAIVAAARPVATIGVERPKAEATVGLTAAAAASAPARSTGVAVSTSTANASNGIYIEFDGARWYGSGRAVSYSPGLFVPAGTYSGVPVYRLTTDHRDRIWVPVVAGGPLAPYSKR
jgi:hypothetical protein